MGGGGMESQGIEVWSMKRGYSGWELWWGEEGVGEILWGQEDEVRRVSLGVVVVRRVQVRYDGVRKVGVRRVG